MAGLSVQDSNDLADTVKRVAEGGERVILKRRGRPAAAIVSMEDLYTLKKLEALEDASDARVAKRRLAAVRSGRAKTISWDEVKRRLRKAERAV